MLLSIPLMFSNLTLVSVDFKLKVGGVQYQGKELGWSEPNPGKGIARNLPVLSAFQGLGPEGSRRKMMGPPLGSGDIVLSSGVLGSTAGSRADEQASRHWRSTPGWQEPPGPKENTLEGWARCAGRSHRLKESFVAPGSAACRAHLLAQVCPLS